MPRAGVRIATAAVAALLLAGCSATGADEPTRGADQQGYVGSGGALTRIPPDQREPAPTLSGKQLGADGKTVSTADYAGKVRLIAVGFGEVATAVNNAAVHLDPGAPLFPGHSTDEPHAVPVPA